MAVRLGYLGAGYIVTEELHIQGPMKHINGIALLFSIKRTCPIKQPGLEYFKKISIKRTVLSQNSM